MRTIVDDLDPRPAGGDLLALHPLAVLLSRDPRVALADQPEQILKAIGATTSILSSARLHRNYVGACERGEINLAFRVLLQLSAGLEVSLSEIIGSYEKLEGADIRLSELVGGV